MRDNDVNSRDEPNSVWSLEVCYHEDAELGLFLKDVRDPTCPILSAGPVVAVTKTVKDDILVLIENFTTKRWTRFCASSTKYSPLLCVDWVARGEKSIVEMGFFPTQVTVEHLFQRHIHGIMTVTQLLKGFLHVRAVLTKNSKGFHYPNTWKLQKMVLGANLTSLPGLDAKLVFGNKFDQAQCKKWILAEQKKEKVLGKKKVVDVVLGKKKVVDVDEQGHEYLKQPLRSRPKMMATKVTVTSKTTPTKRQRPTQSKDVDDLAKVKAKKQKS